MRTFSIAPAGILTCAWNNRNLILALVKREVVGRYRGSVMGILWSFISPLIMLAVYTFVFGVVFGSRWNPTSESKAEFAIVLFVGLIVFNLFAECVIRAPGLIGSNVNYVKKVIFPLEILPWVNLGSSVFHASISLLVWIGAYVIFFGIPGSTSLLLPVVLLPLLFFTMGVCWFLASIGVYLRDVAQFIGIATNVLMFLSPVFFPVTALPVDYRPYLYANPLTSAIELARDVLIWGKMPDWPLLALHYFAAVGIAWLGFAWFQKTRSGFSDVL